MDTRNLHCPRCGGEVFEPPDAQAKVSFCLDCGREVELSEPRREEVELLRLVVVGRRR